MKVKHVLTLAVGVALLCGCGSRVPSPPSLSAEPKITVSGLDDYVTVKEKGLSENKKYVVVVVEKLDGVNMAVPITKTYKAGGAVIGTEKDVLPFDVIAEKTYELTLPGRYKGKVLDEIDVVGPGKPKEE